MSYIDFNKGFWLTDWYYQIISLNHGLQWPEEILNQAIFDDL